jgi:hypothetical protein
MRGRTEANEIILINSHDGASSHQMLAGQFRFVCHNRRVVGDVANGIRVPHKGDVQNEVIEGGFHLSSFHLAGNDELRQTAANRVQRGDSMTWSATGSPRS